MLSYRELKWFGLTGLLTASGLFMGRLYKAGGV